MSNIFDQGDPHVYEDLLDPLREGEGLAEESDPDPTTDADFEIVVDEVLDDLQFGRGDYSDARMELMSAYHQHKSCRHKD